MKYYIKITDKRVNKVFYKRYKCIEGFAYDKNLCWQFSKQGAKKIIERLKYEYRYNDNLVFELEAVE